MSHNIEHRTYTERKDKKAIESEINQYVRKATWQEGGHGLESGIRFIDKVMPDYQSAMAFLEQNDRGWYDCLAVKYKELPSGKSTKKLDDLKEKLRIAYTEYELENRKVVASDFKSDFIGCKNCGSKIRREYLNSNFCPVCQAVMRSDTIIKKLAAMNAIVNKLRNDIKEEEKRLAEKSGQICWLVKFEYHT